MKNNANVSHYHIPASRAASFLSCELQAFRPLLLLLGAGMSVDAGVPDYRSKGGFYTADSPFAGIPDFMSLLSGRRLDVLARESWLVWRKQLQLFTEAVPHAGYHYLAALAKKRGEECFTITSNGDALTARSGFPSETLHMCHGNKFALQCSGPCVREVWSWEKATGTHPLDPAIDVPLCPRCGAPARPNVYFFGDSAETYVWEAQQPSAERFAVWLERYGKAMLMLEIGCGTGAPGLRLHAERYLRDFPASRLIRINLHETDFADPQSLHILGDRAVFLDTIDALPEDKAGSPPFEKILPPDWKYCGIKTTAKSVFEFLL